MHSGFIVESKKNNSELYKSVARIDDEDKYYILMDHSVDNPDVLREIQRLHATIKGKDNIQVIEVHSFEFVLLSFRLLENWVFAEKDDLKEKRSQILAAKDLFLQIMIRGGDMSQLTMLKKMLGAPESLNSEQISSRLLFKITQNTGFETQKGTLGDCFIVDCCDWDFKTDSDICGLDDHRISADEKLRTIFEYSVLKDAFAKVGL